MLNLLKTNVYKTLMMVGAQKQEVTELLRAWSNGDQTALEELTPFIYGELHRLARHYMGRERQNNILQTTALVNEVYMRLINWETAKWNNRAHFFGVSAQLMRRILVDHARKRRRNKRGGDRKRLELNEKITISTHHNEDLIAIDDLLNEFTRLDPRQAQIVELRFFGGMSATEVAEHHSGGGGVSSSSGGESGGGAGGGLPCVGSLGGAAPFFRCSSCVTAPLSESNNLGTWPAATNTRELTAD